MSKSTTKTFKHTVWYNFSLYIRARDANSNGLCKCCTCNKIMFWKSPDCNAGHFIPGRGGAVLYDDTIVHTQCSNCNNPSRGGGKYLEYEEFMRKQYNLSLEELEEIKQRRHIIKKHTMEELKELNKTFKNAFEEERKKKGL